MKLTPLLPTGITTLIVTAFCLAPGTATQAAEKDKEKAKAAKDKAKAEAPALVAVLHPTEGNEAHGTVTFEKTGKGKVKITAEVMGLKPDSAHAIHVHEYGDTSADDGTSAGGHFNPEGHDHGLPGKDEKRHAGDMGNLEADAKGKAHYTLEVDNMMLTGKHSILGRAVIVHEGKDKGVQPTGDAGPRIAQGVIGIRNPEAAE